MLTYGKIMLDFFNGGITMNVIVCVDDSLGMLFNNRRQSRDSVLINRVIDMCDKSRLWIGEFSRSLFSTFDCPIMIINDNFLNEAVVGDYCFVENVHLTPIIDKIEKLIVYKWNRSYPSDFQLDIDLSKWSLISSNAFKGSSHEEITMEVYKR